MKNNKIVRAGLVAVLLCVNVSSWSEEKSKQLTAEELIFDWDSSVYETVSFGALVGIIDLGEKYITIGDNLFHQLLIRDLDRNHLFYLAKKNDSYYFRMDVVGKPLPEDEFGISRNFVPTSAEFFGMVAVAASSGGLGYMSYSGGSDAEATLRDHIFVNEVADDCCVISEHWVPVSDLVKGQMYLSAYVLDGVEDYSLHVSIKHAQAAASQEAKQQCEEVRSERNLLEKAAYSCDELFAEALFE